MIKVVLGYFSWLYSTWQLEHHLYMKDLVYSMLELQCSLAFIVGAAAAFCCNRKQKLLRGFYGYHDWMQFQGV